MQQHDVGYPADCDEAALFDRYGEIIFAYIRVHTATREDAEDLTLEVFTAAVEHNNLANFIGEQLAWLKRVARNKLVDYYRRTQHRSAIPIDQFAEILLDDEPDPEELTLRREELHQLRLYVQNLPQFQQRLLHLRYGLGLRCSEIALILDKRETAVRQQLSRTIKHLRTMYYPPFTQNREDA